MLSLRECRSRLGVISRSSTSDGGPLPIRLPGRHHGGPALIINPSWVVEKISVDGSRPHGPLAFGLRGPLGGGSEAAHGNSVTTRWEECSTRSSTAEGVGQKAAPVLPRQKALVRMHDTFCHGRRRWAESNPRAATAERARHCVNERSNWRRIAFQRFVRAPGLPT